MQINNKKQLHKKDKNPQIPPRDYFCGDVRRRDDSWNAHESNHAVGHLPSYPLDLTDVVRMGKEAIPLKPWDTAAAAQNLHQTSEDDL